MFKAFVALALSDLRTATVAASSSTEGERYDKCEVGSLGGLRDLRGPRSTWTRREKCQAKQAQRSLPRSEGGRRQGLLRRRRDDQVRKQVAQRGDPPGSARSVAAAKPCVNDDTSGTPVSGCRTSSRSSRPRGRIAYWLASSSTGATSLWGRLT